MRDDNEPMNHEEGARLQNLDEQIDQRLRERPRPADPQETLDPELLRDLQAMYQPRAQRFQSGLDRVWNRLEQQGTVPAQPYRQRSRSSDRSGLRKERPRPMKHLFRTGQRWSTRVTSLVAVALLVILVGGLTLGLILVRHNGNSSTGSPSNQATATIKRVPFTVTSVDMAVSPATLTGLACGTQTTVTYTATFHIAPGGPGGTIQFEYTTNNGRGSTNASVSVAAGQTTATYSFTWSGQLPADHTAPGNGGVIVTSPNQVNSALVAPTGSCS
jgi:hypothetical protein